MIEMLTVRGEKMLILRAVFLLAIIQKSRYRDKLPNATRLNKINETTKVFFLSSHYRAAVKNLEIPFKMRENNALTSISIANILINIQEKSWKWENII